MKYYFLMQIVLGVQRHNEDEGNWMQLLVFVVLAAFYVIGGILKKAADKKIKLEDDKEPEKAPKSDRYRQGRQHPSAGRTEDKRAGTTVRRPAARVQRALLRHLQAALEPELPPAVPSIEPVPRKEEKPIAKPLKELERPADVYTEADDETLLPIEHLLGFDDPDELKRAILHYEILGKPISLRK